MSNLSIKDVPEAWAESLRQRAARNHRSLQGELMAIIEQAVRDGTAPLSASGSVASASGSRPGTIAGHDRQGHPIIRQGWKTIEQISAEMRTKYSVPIEGAPLAVDIIREERDVR